MNIAHCPECKKAGLRHESPVVIFHDPPPSPAGYIDWLHRYPYWYWCPRCKKWVKPEYKKVL